MNQRPPVPKTGALPSALLPVADKIYQILLTPSTCGRRKDQQPWEVKQAGEALERVAPDKGAPLILILASLIW